MGSSRPQLGEAHNEWDHESTAGEGQHNEWGHEATVAMVGR